MQDFTLDKGKLAIILAGLFCLYAVYGAVSGFKIPSDTDVVEPAQQIVELDPVNIQLLTKTHLFGQPPQVQVAAKRKAVGTNRNSRKAVNNAAKKPSQKRNTNPVKINVTVTGLLASNDVDFSAAILKVDNKPEKLYRVGEDLGKPEVKLQSVELESVIIDNNGNEQIIAMKRPGLESNNKGANNQRSTRSNSNRNSNQIPELPPELELPEGLQLLNNASFDGAYSPPIPEPVDIDEPPLPDELEEQLLLEQMSGELDEDIQAQLEAESTGVQVEEIPPIPELEGEASSTPNFQMPVF